jgi:mannosyl-3-phosphoglycerate phosphatase
MPVSYVVFTDLDGTLLDDAYSFAPALQSLSQIREASIPLVICSSKTRKEIEYYRGKLENHDPFVSENGGGVFVPTGYFGFRVVDFEFAEEPGADVVHQTVFGADVEYEAICLGVPYPKLRDALATLRRNGCRVRGFGDMSVQEVAGETGLPLDQARMAKERDLDEPFLIEGSKNEREQIFRAVKEMGLQVSRGRRFYHLTGSNDKGRAVKILSDLFRATAGNRIVTIGLGGDPNDLSMLQTVDHAIMVQKPDSGYDPALLSQGGFIKADGPGPVGWNKAILGLLRGEM